MARTRRKDKSVFLAGRPVVLYKQSERDGIRQIGPYTAIPVFPRFCQTKQLNKAAKPVQPNQQTMKNVPASPTSSPSTNRFLDSAYWAPVLFASMLLAGCSSNTTAVSSTVPAINDQSPNNNVSAESSSNDNNDAVHEVAVKIDTMMCIEGCFNGIKTVLEKRPGIEGVRLAPQKEEGTIDNSMIYIKHRGVLDTTEMERLILGAGFEKIEFVK
ncbi:MAG: heavy-metal-associated domain-containing protein [Pirellula sp.]|jgi:copper chaperone CopZ|nr:heavy-metal-associated domain-containing protein [Pirellula sp.]